MTRIQVLIHEPCPPDVQARQFEPIAREAATDAVHEWHKDMLASHFVAGAASRYGYQPRKLDYLVQKQRLARRGKAILGGVVDDVKTGLLRDMVTAIATIRASRGMTTLTMQGPFYANMRKNGSPDKAAEITTVLSDQRSKLAKTQQEVATEKLDALRQPRTTRIE